MHKTFPSLESSPNSKTPKAAAVMRSIHRSLSPPSRERALSVITLPEDFGDAKFKGRNIKILNQYFKQIEPEFVVPPSLHITMGIFDGLFTELEHLCALNGNEQVEMLEYRLRAVGAYRQAFFQVNQFFNMKIGI